MALTQEAFEDAVEDAFEYHHSKMFETIDESRKQFKPSEVESFLRRWHGHGIASEWKSWWLESGEDYE